MKVKVKDYEFKKFKPVTFEVTVESEEELLELWHRLNCAGSAVSENSNLELYRLPNNWDNMYEFFENVSDVVYNAMSDWD